MHVVNNEEPVETEPQGEIAPDMELFEGGMWLRRVQIPGNPLSPTPEELNTELEWEYR